MAKDYYNILGVNKTASQEEVKKAYNNLVSENVSIIINTKAKDGINDSKDFKLNLYKLGSLESLF